MKLILSPIATFEDDTPPFVDGDVLHYRNNEFDFSPLGEGEEIEVGEPFEGVVRRINGMIEVVLQYKYSIMTAEPDQSPEWSDFTFIVEAGQCPCPIVRKPVVPESTPDPEPESVAEPEPEAEVFPA